MRTVKATLYARVSSKEQKQGYSIDAQWRAFQAIRHGGGWTAYFKYLEGGKSAHTENINKRPVSKEAIADALDKKFDIFVAHKIDRFPEKNEP